MKTSAGRRAWRGTPVLLAGLLGAGLMGLVALDDAATRRELRGLLRDQASAVRATVEAAARANQEAARLAAQQLESRLLDNARLLRELDRRAALTEELIEAVAQRHGLFRVSVFAADGAYERGSRGRGHGPAPGRGFGRGLGPGGGQGRGEGRGGGAGLVQRVLRGEDEVSTGLHQARWRKGARIAVAVRRAAGGAILLNVDATTLDALSRGLRLETVLDEIVASTPELAYVVFTRGEDSIARGATGPPAGAQQVAQQRGEREVEHEGRRYLEVYGPVELSSEDDDLATLRLGMAMAGIERAHRRMLWILAVSLAATLALASLGVGATWLRRRYALLSAEHQRAEAALRRRDRLSAMGELAASVAHEIRNPLNAIAMSAQRLRREIIEPALDPQRPERAEGIELLALLSSETARINRIVEQFLEFARPSRPAPRRVDMQALLREAAASSRDMAEARGVRLETSIERATDADIDPDQMRQAVDNLLRNAIEASEHGGLVRLVASSTATEHTILVEDSGAGIPAETLPRIFDLYYTTKADGTGVGLAIAQRIATAHDGTVEVESTVGRGTRMTIRLPRQGETGA